MIVYGDPSERESFRTLVERLRKSLSAVRRASLDDARAFLIQAGMLEQAVEDALPEWAAPCRRLTDAAAGFFVDAWAESQGRPSPCGSVMGHTDREDALAELPRLDAILTLKQPEGFAFYTLYPEAYASAALTWREAHPEAAGHDSAPVVVGVRSIGTTLSAVVAATLRAEGLAAGRLTLRPTGPPFSREASLSDPLGVWLVSHATHALIVDEGPGLSGSSMAAAAQAVHAAGLPRDRIAFLPGHGNEPGGMASEAVRRWWRETPRVVVPTEDLRWEGRTLEETLLDATEDGIRIEELTGGRWRARAYADEDAWPPVALPFERRKLLVTRVDGSRILYKFVGFSPSPSGSSWEGGFAEGGDEKTAVTESTGVVSQVDEGERTLGFAPAPWIDGLPLTPADATPALLAQIARHIAAVAGPPLPPPEADAALDRLTHLLHHNAEEAGLPPLQVARLRVRRRGRRKDCENEVRWRRSPGGEGVGGEETKTSGDYRLAPHEWRRLPDGTVVKTNRRPANGDHTTVGRQPVAWDVAGAIVEWSLDETSAKPLLRELEREGLHTTEGERRFYRAAYAAFQMGLCAHCAPLAPEAERKRLEAAAARYRTTLRHAVESPDLKATGASRPCG